jgi:hypothetical protein
MSMHRAIDMVSLADKVSWPMSYSETYSEA